jgi:hypothetical protein
MLSGLIIKMFICGKPGHEAKGYCGKEKSDMTGAARRIPIINICRTHDEKMYQLPLRRHPPSGITETVHDRWLNR